METKKSVEKMRPIGNDFYFKVLCHFSRKRVFVGAKINIVTVLFCLSDISKSKTLFGVPSFTGKDVENVSSVLVSQLLDLRSRFVVYNFTI